MDRIIIINRCNKLADGYICDLCFNNLGDISILLGKSVKCVCFRCLKKTTGNTLRFKNKERPNSKIYNRTNKLGGK
jgi:hypothetical protein